MRRYQRQQLGSPRRVHALGCVLLVLLACAGCRSAAAVNSSACTTDGATTRQAASQAANASAAVAEPGAFWKFCHRKRVPELGPTLSPFLPVPTVDVFSGMPLGVKPVAVVVPGSLDSTGPLAPGSSAPAAPPQTVPPPALLPQSYAPDTNTAPDRVDGPAQDHAVPQTRPLPVQLASGSETSAEPPRETRPEAAPLSSPGPSTLRIRKESLRAETADPAAAD